MSPLPATANRLDPPETVDPEASVLSHVILYRAAQDFLLSARRDDEQWRAPREEEQRSRRQERPADW